MVGIEGGFYANRVASEVTRPCTIAQAFVSSKPNVNIITKPTTLGLFPLLQMRISETIGMRITPLCRRRVYSRATTAMTPTPCVTAWRI